THAGLNTALESLAAGVPMVAIPVGNDQPGVAARISWIGAGELLPVKQLSARRLRPLLEKVLHDPGYRASSRRWQAEIVRAEGLRRAAEIIEQVVKSQAPVLRSQAAVA